ncbi:DUF4153 domain-containing protein [Candidatus Trichorickettsia mobilis]|uniref:DUF4153 domain-containing protein n=1 Tax=Candidatus Trichorickettsia mobilis TaxID=1346319 RepID=A0ABZ0UVY2_9RICK|nr:DUF4153 domain-containing protein [Candidatus Trichorickettsia mobilis]WPY00194.1 DUF4153 domain-containing protein [Candidatus Trichorickettsia mobilis]
MIKNFIDSNIYQLKKTLCRFSLVILCSVFFTLLALLALLEPTKIIDATDLVRWLLILFCGFFWFLAVKLFAESNNYRDKFYYALSIPIFLLISWYLSTKSTMKPDFIFYFTLILFLSIFVSPFLFKKTDNEIVWSFNYHVYFNLAFTIFVAIVLFLGISFIALTLYILFDIKIPGEFYFGSWIVVSSFFAPIFALFNFTTDCFKKLDYLPLGLKIMMSYICVPLSIIYLIILYIYIIKIMINWQLPDGGIVYLVSGFAGLAISSFVASYPIINQGKNIISYFYHYFFKLMVAPLILMAIAIAARINQYGFTEARYMVLIWLIWLISAIILGLINSRTNTINNMHKVAIILLLIALFSPLSAENVASYSQFNRLTQLLKSKQTDQQRLYEDIYSIVNYMVKSNKVNNLKLLFIDQPNAYINITDPKSLKAEEIVKELGVTDLKHESDFNITFNDFYSYIDDGILIEEYDLLTSISTVRKIIKVNDQQLTVFFEPSTSMLTITNEKTNHVVYFNLENIRQQYIVDIPTKRFIAVESVDRKLRVKLLLTQIGGTIYNQKPTINSLTGLILIKIKDSE